jgi:hypothetical protein
MVQDVRDQTEIQRLTEKWHARPQGIPMTIERVENEAKILSAFVAAGCTQIPGEYQNIQSMLRANAQTRQKVISRLSKCMGPG